MKAHTAMYFPSTPLSYAVEITFECNNSCTGCANVWKTHASQEMCKWKAVFDKIAPLDNRCKYSELIRITGGEPTLHKEFHQIIEYIDTFGIEHAVFTNGCWPKPGEIIDLYRHCKNFVGMLVSIHGSTEHAHNAFTGNAGDRSFDETCENIQRASKAGLNVFTNTVLTKYSCDQIKDIIALSKDLGANHAVFNRFLGDTHPLEPSDEQLMQAIILIEDLQSEGRDCHIGNCIPQCFMKNSSQGSNAGIEHCAISPSGLVRPDNLTNYIFGNIFDQSVEDIWQSEKARWFRNQIPDPCFECVELSHCRGGNRLVSVEHGLEKDRLMKEPVREALPETIEIDPGMIPVPNYRIREEPFGYLVTRCNWSVSVTPEAKPVLDAINGQNTLAEIYGKFGDDALNLIAHLFSEGCLRFKEKL